MDNKTISDLNTKKSYRFAKVLFIFLYALIVFVVYISSIGEPGRIPRGFDDYVEFVITILIISAIFEAIRRAVYYVALGTINPPK